MHVGREEQANGPGAGGQLAPSLDETVTAASAGRAASIGTYDTAQSWESRGVRVATVTVIPRAASVSASTTTSASVPPTPSA